MPNPKHQQRRQHPVQHLAVRAVEFRHQGEDEGQGYGFEEVGLRAGGEVEGVELVGGGGGGGGRGWGWGCGGEAVAHVGFCGEAVVDDAVGEEEEVGCEGEGPGAGDG